MSADPVNAYDRSTLVDIVVYHWRTDKSGCGCGWAELGKSYPHHIADVYEASLRARSETSSVREDTEFMREIHDAAYEDGRSTGFRQGLAEAAKAIETTACEYGMKPAYREGALWASRFITRNGVVAKPERSPRG